MINLFRAEWKKNLGNYRLTSFLVWVYPVGIAAFYLLMNSRRPPLRDFKGWPASLQSWVVD